MRSRVFAECQQCGHAAMMREGAACGHCAGAVLPSPPPGDLHEGWRCHCKGCLATPC